MIGSRERRIWQELERCYAAEIDELVLPGLRAPHGPRPTGRGVDDLPAVVVSGIWVSILLVLVGFVLAGLAVGAATTLGALLWR